MMERLFLIAVVCVTVIMLWDSQVLAEEAVAAHLQKISELHVDYPLLTSNEFALAGVKNVRYIGLLTGENSENKTKSRFSLDGTDVGVPVEMDGKMYFLFGDSYYDAQDKSKWISNCLAFTSDLDYTDGIRLEGMTMETTRQGIERMAPLFNGMKLDRFEYTKIPTGAISIGHTLYASFMSVKHWGAADEWECGFGGIAMSEDEGKTWTVLKELKWPGDKFALLFPVIDGDYVYVWGTPGGRLDSARLMRVPLAQYTEFDAYEYYTGLAEDGTPIFEKGEDALQRSAVVIEDHVGELSAMYSPYLGEWIVTYGVGHGWEIVMRSAKHPWGPYSDPVTIAVQKDFAMSADYMKLYCAYMHPAYTSEDGSKVCFLMSHYWPIYQVMVMEMELVKNELP